MSESPLTLLPQHAGANLAPIDPLLKIGEGQKRVSDSLSDAIRERYRHFLNLESPTWDEMIRAGEQTALFFQGKQFLMQTKWGFVPFKVSGRNEQERRALNLMQYHLSGNLEKWLNSNPDIVVRPGVESDEAYESAEAAKIIVNHYESKFYKPRNTTEECLEGLTFGSYVWRLRVDPTLKGATAYRQIFENREVKLGPGYGMCGDCGREGSADDFNEIPGEGKYTCPKCHGEAMVIPKATGELPTYAGSEPVELGDFRLDLVPFAACRWDLKCHADESSWLIIRRRTTMGAVRQLLGNIDIQGGGSSDRGLDTIDRLAHAGQAMAGHSRESGRGNYRDGATVEEFWMSADEYGDIQLSRPAQTVSGQEIPGNVRLGDLLKGRPVCVLGLNEMSTVLGVFVEDHRDYVVQGKWYAKKGTGAGRGQQDLVEVQKRLNADDQQIHTYLRGASTPALLVVAEAIGEEGKARYLGTPNQNIPVPMTALKEGMSLDQIARPAFQPTGVPAQFFEYTYNRLGEFAQFASHFLPFTGGIPGVNNTTATGANITQSATNALYTPVLSVKGEIRQLVAEKLVRLYPRHFPVERDFPLGGKFQNHAGRFLTVDGSRLCTDLLFEVIPDSWLPRNSFAKRQDYATFFGMFGGVVGYLQARQADPRRVADMERTFDLELESEERNVAESLCFRRVRQMRQAAGLVQDPMMLVGLTVDPNTGQSVPSGQGAIQPPVSQAEPAHAVKRAWLQAWLDSDEGLDSEPHLRAAVEQLIILHTMYETTQQSYLAGQAGMVQVAGAAPGAMAQRL